MQSVQQILPKVTLENSMNLQRPSTFSLFIDQIYDGGIDRTRTINCTGRHNSKDISKYFMIFIVYIRLAGWHEIRVLKMYIKVRNDNILGLVSVL